MGAVDVLPSVKVDAVMFVKVVLLLVLVDVLPAQEAVANHVKLLVRRDVLPIVSQYVVELVTMPALGIVLVIVSTYVWDAKVVVRVIVVLVVISCVLLDVV